MTVPTIAVITVCFVAVVKLVDTGVLMGRMGSRAHSTGAPDIETPVFELARQLPRAAQRVISLFYRAPMLVLLSTCTIFASSSAEPAVLVLAASLMVPVALNIVSILLLATILERSRGTHVHAVSGLHFDRVGKTERSSETAMDPTFTVLLTAGSFVVAYAALYFAVAVADPHAFHTPPPSAVGGHIGFGVVDAIYFSTVTAATVGFGDIYPVSHVAQAIVVLQILTTAVGVTLFVAYLLRQRGA